MIGGQEPGGVAEVERALEGKIAAWTSHMPWRSDLEDWKRRRLWQEDFQQSKLAEISRYAGSLEGKDILDLGCGMGGLTVALQRKGARVAAVDPNADYCEITRLRGQRYGLEMNVVTAPGEALPFADHAFEVATCYDVLEHAGDPEKLLGEIRRVLRPYGLAFLTVTNRYALRDPHYHLRFVNWMPRRLGEHYIAKRGRSKGGAGFEDRQRLSEMHYFTVWGFKRLAFEAGFDCWDILEEQFFRRISRATTELLPLGLLGQFPLLHHLYRAYRSVSAGAFHVLLQRLD